MPTQQGIVSIVGAGPGDVGLLTVRGRELLDAADVIVYDAFVNADVLPSSAQANGTPELYYVGKRGEHRAVPQEEVRQLLVTLAREGKHVVHLTGGDPFVFGRGSEAAQALNEAGVAFEIVPGVTAGVAATAYAGIPVTHRTLAASVTFVTGRDAPDKAETLIDWRALAKTGGTIVVYNGLKMLPAIAGEMITAGLPGEIPAAAIQAGTRTEQRTVVATLETLAHEAELASLSGAVTIVIGWSVLLRDELAWFDTRPLFGRRIAVVPSVQSSAMLQEQLRRLGATVVAIPGPRPARLDLTALRGDVEQLTDYAWIIFNSPDAVAIFWEQLLILGRDTRALAGVKIGAVGAATVAALLDRGVTVDVLPERFEGSSLVDVLADRSDVVGARLLYVCDDADDMIVPEGLAPLGVDVVVRSVYRLIYDGSGTERIRRRLERGMVDLVVFTSTASVTQYLRAIGEDLSSRAPAAAADEATADTLRGLGIDVIAELSGDSDTSNTTSFADAIARALRTI